jgi:EpsI family protein
VRARALIVAVMIAAAAFAARALATGRNHALDGGPAPLDRFPMAVADWTGHRLPALDPEVSRVLGADQYLNRRYARSSGSPVDLFVAYYHSQRQGDAIHSPRNCLPGAGWQPVASSTVALPLSEGAAATVNRQVIEKGAERRIIFYWYQGRGRIVASEYANKAWLMFDAVRSGRSDGALVRAMTDATEEAEQGARAFLARALPPLSQALP